MPLGAASLRKLQTCDERLRRLVAAVAAGVDAGDLRTAGITDVAVLEGHRGEEEQNQAFARGTSKLRWPKSKHNTLPALAVDLVPYPVDFKDEHHELVLRGYVLAVASALAIPIRVISWDPPHYELA